MVGLSNGVWPSWLRQALSMAQPVQIRFADTSGLTVFPAQRRYASEAPPSVVRDWWQAEAIELQPLSPALDAPSHTLPLTQLCWVMVLQRARQHLAADTELRFQMVRLQSWPALTAMPAEWVTPAARICALLSKKPTTVSLIPLVLDLPPDEVLVLVEALCMNGHVQVLGQGRPSEPALPVADVMPESHQSMIRKIWQRLGARLKG